MRVLAAGTGVFRVIAGESVSIKNMTSQEQIKISLKDLNEWLKQNY